MEYNEMYKELIREKYRFSKFIMEALFKLYGANKHDRMDIFNKCYNKYKTVCDLIIKIKKDYPDEYTSNINDFKILYSELDNDIDLLVNILSDENNIFFYQYKYLYHVTEFSNLQSIKENGLKRGGLNKSGFAVYLSKDYNSWINMCKDPVLIEVNVRGLQHKMSMVDKELDEILIWDDINIDRLIFMNI